MAQPRSSSALASLQRTVQVRHWGQSPRAAGVVQDSLSPSIQPSNQRGPAHLRDGAIDTFYRQQDTRPFTTAEGQQLAQCTREKCKPPREDGDRPSAPASPSTSCDLNSGSPSPTGGA